MMRRGAANNQRRVTRSTGCWAFQRDGRVGPNHLAVIRQGSYGEFSFSVQTNHNGVQLLSHCKLCHSNAILVLLAASLSFLDQKSCFLSPIEPQSRNHKARRHRQDIACNRACLLSNDKIQELVGILDTGNKYRESSLNISSCLTEAQHISLGYGRYRCETSG